MLSVKKAENRKHYSSGDARDIGEALGIDWTKVNFSIQQFAMGLIVENYEHGSALSSETNLTNDSDQAAGKIAWAHLKELTDYYTRLEKMEGGEKAELPKNLLEKLSKIEHDQWVEWSKAIQDEVSNERKVRWEKYWVPYDDLPDDVKEQDRVYARKVLDIVENYSRN